MIRKISQLLDEKGLTYDIGNTDDGNKYIVFKNRIGDSGPVATYLIGTDGDDMPSDNQHIDILVGNICDNVPRTLPVYKSINSLNANYRFVKFSINDNGELRVNFDSILPYYNSESAIWEMILRLADIISESYPSIMKAVWS